MKSLEKFSYIVKDIIQSTFICIYDIERPKKPWPLVQYDMIKK